MSKSGASETEGVGAAVSTVEARDDSAVCEAWDAYHGEVFAFLLGYTRDAAAAEDLVQDTFLRLVREVRSGHGPQQVRPWLYQVAANLAVSRSRRVLSARRWFERIGVPSHDATAAERSPEDLLVRQEQAGELDQALSRLRPEARTALLLASAGFSGREIAGLISHSEDATRTLMCRARLQLRHSLEAGGER